jgi:hypothetical protein
MGRPPESKAEARRRRARGATLAELVRSYDVGKSTISRLMGKEITVPQIVIEPPTTSSSPELGFPHTHQLHQNIAKWIEANLNTPEFHTFKQKEIGLTLSDDLGEGLEAFVLLPTLTKEHSVITAFHGVHRAQRSLSQCEYYFRRFPFRGLAISRDEHFQNVCEFYFSIFYIMRCRIKITLNNLMVACPNSKLNVKHFLRQFDKEFDYELRARNRVQHHESFEDTNINRISITGILSDSEEFESSIWQWRHRATYRKFSKEWSQRARHRALRMQVFVEAVALGILTGAAFLRFDGDVP